MNCDCSFGCWKRSSKFVIKHVQPILILTALILGAVSPRLTAAGTDPWQGALTPGLNPEARTTALETLERDLTRGGRSSSAVWRNLARVALDRQARGDAAYYLLRSTESEFSPLRNWRTLEALETMQTSLGLRDGAHTTARFWARYLWSTDFLLALGALGFWIAVALVFFARRHVRLPVALTPLCLTFAAAALYGAKFTGHYAVVGGDTQDQPVYRLDATDHAQAIGSLPSGAIVEVHRNRAGFDEIVDPVSAWVPSLGLRKLK